MALEDVSPAAAHFALATAPSGTCQLHSVRPVRHHYALDHFALHRAGRCWYVVSWMLMGVCLSRCVCDAELAALVRALPALHRLDLTACPTIRSVDVSRVCVARAPQTTH